MNTCDTCKHWGPNRAERPIQRIMGACYSPTIAGSISEVADNPSFACIDSPEAPGKLVTGPKFMSRLSKAFEDARQAVQDFGRRFKQHGPESRHERRKAKRGKK